MMNMNCNMAPQNMQPGMDAGMRSGMSTGMQPGMSAGMQSGMNAGMQPGMDTGMRSGMSAGMQPGMGAGMQQGSGSVRTGMFQNPGNQDSRCMLRRQIDEASFAMDDAHLFLDTHPEDAVAFQYFKNAVALRQNVVNAYERQFGPIQVEDAVGNTWSWVTEKWPWEGDC